MFWTPEEILPYEPVVLRESYKYKMRRTQTVKNHEDHSGTLLDQPYILLIVGRLTIIIYYRGLECVLCMRLFLLCPLLGESFIGGSRTVLRCMSSTCSLSSSGPFLGHFRIRNSSFRDSSRCCKSFGFEGILLNVLKHVTGHLSISLWSQEGTLVIAPTLCFAFIEN